MSFWDNIKVLSTYSSYYLIDHNREFLMNLFQNATQEVIVCVCWYVKGQQIYHQETVAPNDSAIERALGRAALKFHADKGYYPNSELIQVSNIHDFDTLERQALVKS